MCKSNRIVLLLLFLWLLFFYIHFYITGDSLNGKTHALGACIVGSSPALQNYNFP